ncbi:carnitine acetyl transferase [Mycena capillaripes]|nr:carnitine acetyl transferase [Mycena capillaripes]
MSVSQPPEWKAAAPEPLPGTKTFAAQASLPLLPVPELGTTLTRLKDSLKPLAWSEAELAAAEAKIAEFGTEKGPELHQRLLERSKHHKHWLEEWWDNTGYLGYRDSVVVNVSYYYGFDAHPRPTKAPISVARAAYLARATMQFRQQYKLGLLEPEATKEGPICMDTYRWMFDCCRVPGPEGLDWSVTYAKPGDTGDSGHIIVFRNNRPWKVQTTQDGRILSIRELEKQIQHILDNSDGEYPGVGVLSASNRDIWAKDYTELASSPHNAAILQAIQSAAFTISLDSSSPITPKHHSRALWHGDVSEGVPIGLQNRWVDKPVQYIVFDNGFAGLMGEHSTMDGTPTVRLCDDVLNAIASSAFDLGEEARDATPLTPTPLDWQLSPATVMAIDAANAAALELVEGQELGFHLTKYGKAAIKRFGVSPDSWAQMIVQLAYRRLLEASGAKRMGGTYEAASTRRFYKGRTEAIRVVSTESDAWVAAMDAPDVALEEKKKLFDAAVKTHGTLARAAGMGQGVDRHMFGLKKLLKPGEEVPALFADPLFVRSSNWVLSTSAVFSKHFPVYGWGEVVPDGFGVAYMTGYDDRLQYTITSRKESPNAQFCEEIARAAEDLYDLHAELKESSSGKPRL